MALDDTTLVIPGVGYIYTAPTGTAKPASAAAPATPWVDDGHTSEDGLSVTFELKTTKRKTWRSRAGVRVTVDDMDLTLGWTALQLDNETLAQYFGGGDITAPGVFGVVKTPAPVERAMFVRLVDGTHEVDLYVAKAAIAAAGEIKATPEDFTGFELQATILDHAAAAHLMQWLAPNLGTPAG